MTDQTIDTHIDAIDSSCQSETSSTPSPPGSFETIKFTGNASEYFGIWISNLILSLLTLGIYSAWAKVRRISYFYNNTNIRNVDFVYHATGGQIFKGRVIVFTIFLAYSAIQAFVPIISLAFTPIILLAMPWLINKSMRFNARMTSWRNVRLDWHGTYWKTFFFNLIAPLLSVLSLGLLLPLISRHYYNYYANSHSFGTTRFKADSQTGKYYEAFFIGAVVPVIPILVLLGLSAASVYIEIETTNTPDALVIQLQIMMMIAFLIFLVATTLYSAMCRNILLQSLTLGSDVKFDSSINPWKLLWIYLSNFAVVMLTIGLMSPWAAVRLYSYLADNTHYHFLTDEHQFIDKKREEMSAFGEEFADWEGWEMSI